MSLYCDELSFENCADSFTMEPECDGYELQEEPIDGFAMWQGLVGPYFTPSVSPDGELSWSNNGELPNPQAVNIKGPPGEGLTIKGIAASVEELPASAEQGDVWLVGSAAPYEGYVRNAGTWVSIGELSVGPAGPPGDPGADGTTFTPSVSAEGVISWTNDGGKTNPQPVNIKGPQGEAGSPGLPGSPGAPGADGTDGTTFTPAVSAEGVISWTNDGGKTNPQPVNIKGPQGETGATGATGPQGPQGETGATGPQGPQGETGATGPQGPQGETGATGPQGPAGQDAPLPIHFSATISSLPLTISDARILADTSTEESRVTDVELGTPSAIASDHLSWTTAAGSVTFSGTLLSGGSTTIDFDITRCAKQ